MSQTPTDNIRVIYDLETKICRRIIIPDYLEQLDLYFLPLEGEGKLDLWLDPNETVVPDVDVVNSLIKVLVS